MAKEDAPRPLYRVTPTGDALDLAEELARALGQPFDRRAVATQSITLHETMFADAAAALGVDPAGIAFHSGVYSQARAFAALSGRGMPHIALDLVFDFIIFSLGHIATVLATVALTPEEVRRLDRALEDVFSLFIDNHRFGRLRESVRPLLIEHAICLNLSHALTRAMTVSVMCHEIAHVHLSHLDRPASREIEFEADRLGADYFLRLVEIGGSRGPTTAYVDPKIAAAPILLLRILNVFERWLGKRGFAGAASTGHPPARERADAVEAIMRPRLVEKAIHILDGMTLTLDELEARL